MEKEITKEDIIIINKSIVEKFGTIFGIINESNIDFILAKLRNSKNVFRKAAELLCCIARGHPFVDGNKRTAFQAAKFLLNTADVRLKVDEMEGEQFMLKVVSSETLTIKEIEIWIRNHSDKNE